MSSYTTGLGTVIFTATEESWAESSNSEVNVIGFPGGDAIAISISGQRETTRTFKALFSSVANYRTFAGMRARTGTLSVDVWDVAPVNAVLKTVAPDKVYVDGSVLAQAQFILY